MSALSGVGVGERPKRRPGLACVVLQLLGSDQDRRTEGSHPVDDIADALSYEVFGAVHQRKDSVRRCLSAFDQVGVYGNLRAIKPS